MTPPVIDVIIAVHSARRPISRAVASVIDHTEAAVRVNVIAHNIDPDIILANLGEYAAHPNVRLLSLRDDIPSPAGPMNLGLDRATGRFVSVMGSDDELAPGALDSWLARQRATGATTVLAKIHITSRGMDPYPPVRMGRRRQRLDAVKDRLAYRSAPLGLIDRARFPNLRFTAGLPSGEDLAYSATLWFTGENITYDMDGPPYRVHDDAGDRVTFSTRTVAADFAFLDALEETPWFEGLSKRERTALAVKLVRVHFFDAVLARAKTAEGIAPHRDDLREVIERLSGWSPQAVRLLALVDRDVVDEVLSAEPDDARVLRLLGKRWAYRSPAALLPRNPLLALHRQAPLRTLAAGVLSTRFAAEHAE